MDKRVEKENGASNINKEFEQSCGLISAVANLLVVASDSESRNLTDALDNTTLLQLANAIYREALILDTLYTQLLEVHEQARSNFCTPYEGLPQLPIPMSRLTLQQLNEAKLETQRQIELLLVHEAADADSSVPKKIACLKSLRGNLEAELIRREYPL